MLAVDEAMMRIQQVQKAIAITEIQEIEDGAIVTRPFPLAVARAYPYYPRSSTRINDSPVFLNAWDLTTVDYQSALQTGEFSCHMQLLVRDADLDRACAIATAFLPQTIKAFASAIKLGAWGPATVRQLRGGTPTLGAPAMYEGFIGLDLYLDIYLNTFQEMAP